MITNSERAIIVWLWKTAHKNGTFPGLEFSQSEIISRKIASRTSLKRCIKTLRGLSCVNFDNGKWRGSRTRIEFSVTELRDLFSKFSRQKSAQKGVQERGPRKGSKRGPKGVHFLDPFLGGTHSDNIYNNIYTGGRYYNKFPACALAREESPPQKMSTIVRPQIEPKVSVIGFGPNFLDDFQKSKNTQREIFEKSRKQPHCLPEDFEPSPDTIEFAQQNDLPDPSGVELSKFIDYYRGTSQRRFEWDGLYLNWLRRAKDFYRRDNVWYDSAEDFEL